MGERSITTQIASAMEQSEQHTDEMETAEVGQRLDELEGALMDNVDGDERLSSGVQPGEDSADLDFIQMTGLATSSRPSYRDDEQYPDRGEYPDNDTVSFFEEGVGDVDGRMDPMAPMLPEMDIPATQLPDTLGSDAAGESVSDLNAIISELNQLESAAGNPSPALEIEPAPRREERPHETETSRAFAQLAVLQGGTVEVAESIEPETTLEVVESIEPKAPLSEAEYDDLAIAETLEADSVSTINDLQEAKSLLDELDVGGDSSVDPSTLPDRSAPLRAPAPVLTLDNMGVTPPDDVPSKSYLRQRHRRQRRFGRWGIRIVLALLLMGGAYVGAQFYLNQAETPEDAFRSAQQLLEEGQYEQASKKFQSFARRFPSDLNSSDAMFMAGYSMQLAPPMPHGTAQAAYTQSLKLLERFIVENPSHHKAARAETLMGLLYFKMDMPSDAIRILGGSDRRLRDPSGYLTSLRTLARAYASVSQIENARSAFMRAASLEENIAPDEDYVELGTMYHKLAERSATAGVERDYRLRAIEQWDYALRVPGLLKSRREEIRLMRDIVAGSVDSTDVSVQPGNGVKTTG